jgi:hypothetical protein
MRIAIKAVLAATFALWPSISLGQHVSFFPTHPPNAINHIYRGVITHYGVGNGRGDLTIVGRSGREISFAVSRPYRINGRTISCHQAPRANYRPPIMLCSDWPVNVILGRSKIDVTYWRSTENGSPVKVSDAFKTVSQAPRVYRLNRTAAH